MVPKLVSSLLLQTSLWIDSISFYLCKVTCLIFISCFHAYVWFDFIWRCHRFYDLPNVAVTLLLARRKQVTWFRQRCKGVGERGNTGSPQYPFAHREYWMPWKWYTRIAYANALGTVERRARTHLYMFWNFIIVFTAGIAV